MIGVEVSSCAGFVGLVAQNISDPAVHTGHCLSVDFVLQTLESGPDLWLIGSYSYNCMFALDWLYASLVTCLPRMVRCLQGLVVPQMHSDGHKTEI